MSDYFTRLAERAVGAAETINPRVPTRFEPAVQGAGIMLSAQQDDELTVETSRIGIQPDSSAENLPHQNINTPVLPASLGTKEQVDNVDRPVNQAAPSRKATTSELSEPQRESMTMQPIPTTPLANASKPEVKPHNMISPLPSMHDMHDTKQDTTTKDKLRIDSSNNEAYIAQPEKTLHTEQLNTLAETVSLATPQSLSEHTQIQQPSTLTTKVQRSSPIKPDQAPPVLTPRKKQQYDLPQIRADSTFESTASALQKPTIKVTIGRVEVRAIMEPPKPPSRSRKPVKSTISLDDYLKRNEARQ